MSESQLLLKTSFRILLIEDNPGDARLVKELLSDIEGMVFEIEWAQKLSDGLECLHNVSFDAILLDLSLPDSHGFKTIERVREKAQAIPLIVLTGLNDELIGIKAVQEGAQDYLVKGTVEGSIFSRIIRYAIERKRTEEVLRESQENLKLKNREILEFTDNVTHDLKKPLSVIKTILTLLRNKDICQLNENGQDALIMGQESLHYMQELLSDLLTCARLESGTQELLKEDVNITEIVRKVTERLKYQIEENKITIIVDSNAIVIADRKGVEKLFMNLIGNAINYIGNGEIRKILIDSSYSNNEHLFRVKDSGMGIPEESLKSIFGKFKRGSNVQGISGSGLGLSIVKSIVEAHNGRIWIDSKVGEGTTFYFTIPSEA